MKSCYKCSSWCKQNEAIPNGNINIRPAHHYHDTYISQKKNYISQEICDANVLEYLFMSNPIDKSIHLYSCLHESFKRIWISEFNRSKHSNAIIMWESYSCFFLAVTAAIIHSSHSLHRMRTQSPHMLYLLYVHFNRVWVLNGNRRKICISTSRFECVRMESFKAFKRVSNRRVNTYFPIIFDQLISAFEWEEDEKNTRANEQADEVEISDQLERVEKNSIAPLGMMMWMMMMAVTAEPAVGCDECR